METSRQYSSCLGRNFVHTLLVLGTGTTEQFAAPNGLLLGGMGGITRRICLTEHAQVMKRMLVQFFTVSTILLSILYVSIPRIIHTNTLTSCETIGIGGHRKLRVCAPPRTQSGDFIGSKVWHWQ